MKKLEELISTYKDFPKKGIYFKDLLEILQEPEVFNELILKMSSSQILKKSEAIISIDASENTINLHVSEDEINKRKLNWKKPKLKVNKGSLYKYARFVSSASKGCVTDEF